MFQYYKKVNSDESHNHHPTHNVHHLFINCFPSISLFAFPPNPIPFPKIKLIPPIIQ